jgi:dTDP-4-amino-4,6-dideoxygalactose transaminase
MSLDLKKDDEIILPAFSYYLTLNKFKFLNSKYKKLTFANAEEFSKNCLSISIHPNMPLSDARRVCSILNKY